MSQEVDRRIAQEVMGEPKPDDLPFEELNVDLWPSYSSNGNWWCNMGRDWTPHRFSTSLGHAMRAVDRYLDVIGEDESLCVFYDRKDVPPYVAFFGLDGEPDGRGGTLPEAICNLLLALKETE